MAINLLDLVKDQVTGQLAKQASSFLGESEEGVSKALDGIFPTILGSLAGKASEEGGISSIVDMIKGADSGIINNISGLFGDGDGSPEGLMEQGGNMLSGLLGDNMGALGSVISKFAGIKGDNATSLLSMAAPMLMGIIGKNISGNGMNASGIQSLLSSQSGFIKDAMPEGLSKMMGGLDLGSIGGLLGELGVAGKGLLGNASGIVGDAASNIGNTGKSAISGATNVASNATEAGKKVVGDAGKVLSGAAGTVGSAGKNIANGAADVAGTAVAAGGSLISTILKWAIPVLGILVAAYFIKGCMEGKNITDSASGALGDTMGVVKGAGNMVEGAASTTIGAVGDVASGAVDAAGNVANGALDAAGNLAASTLGTINEAAKATLDKVSFAVGSAGDQFKSYIDAGAAGDARFRFSNLTFKSGSASMDAASAQEVDNLAAILNAYPDIKVNIEGYTDNTGNAESNVILSKARAEAVKARLGVHGVSPDRIIAKGYGADTPIADNTTAEGRAQNRRIEVTIDK